MKYSYNWLKELSGTKLPPERLASLLTMHSFELEDIFDKATGLERVVVGEIKKIEKHPNADRLQLAKVNIGRQILDIVCGAMNIAVGQKVSVALPGAVLGENLRIMETEIRGVKSFGMLCSKKELGIENDHAGIYVLDKKAKVGDNFSEYLGLNDFQIQFDVLANRGHDALAHIGMAREICILENRKLNFLSPGLRSVRSQGLSSRLNVELKNKNLCRRYIGALIGGIEIMPSPRWMQSRLMVSGLRPINNIVDITNYVMLELGQPLHAFDASVISDNQTKQNIVVRQAKNKEKLKLLDGKELNLSPSNLLITNGKKPLALAGVMGGENSGINEGTSSIVLESANFEPVNIRKTRVEHGLNTESSYRFERDIDPNLAETAAARAIELIQKYGGKDVKTLATADAYPKKIKPWKIKLDLDYVNSLLGEKIPRALIKNILEGLGIRVSSIKNQFDVEIPTIRLDLKTQEDLIEEIGRIYGYENIPAKAPVVELSSPAINEKRVFEDKLRDQLSRLGFSEMLNYSFYSKDVIEMCGLNLDGHYEVANPINPDQQYLRTSLIPGILKNIETNLKSFDKLSIFEIGRIYKKSENNLPIEKSILCSAIINPTEKENIFFDLKGSLETLFAKIGIDDIEYYTPKKNYFFHPTRMAEIKSRDIVIGKIGEINPKLAAQFGIKDRIAVYFLKIEDLTGLAKKNIEYRPINKFPSVRRDISMFVPENVKYADINKKIVEANKRLVNGVELFDVFEKEGKKSMALRIEIGSREKTLTSEEIDGVMNKIIVKLEKDLHVKIRK